MYRVGHRPKSKRRRVANWFAVLAGCAVLALVGLVLFHRWYKPQTSVSQSKVVTKQVSYASKTKTYSESDFTIALPVDWTMQPRPPATPYQSFSWQSADRGSDGQIIEIFEDTIPVNFAVNRVLIVEGQSDQLSLQGAASDNCSNFTKNLSTTGKVGAPAKWNGIDFLCDQANQERDVIGTSSTDGINTVILTSPLSGKTHKFFFTYTDFAINPDYTVFYNALQSFRMQ